MQFGPDFRETHTLKTGDRVTLRMIQPNDREVLKEAILHLSPESRYRRFLAPLGEPTEEMLRYLCEVDGKNHVAIVATTDSLDLKTEVALGAARFVRLRNEPEVAEAAVTVIDDFHGRGLGKLLLASIAAAAKERGISAFRGEVLHSNVPMRHLLKEIGADVKNTGLGTVTFDVPLGEPSTTTLERLLRAAGAQVLELLQSGLR